MYAYRGLSTLPDNPGDSRFWTIPAPTLFAGFSLTLPYGERERPWFGLVTWLQNKIEN